MLIGIHPTVVVMGVSGTGKTTIGHRLATQLAVPFADADDFHSPEAKAKMAAGHALDDEDRAPWLLRLADWLREHPDGCVLACSALKVRYRDVLRSGSDALSFLELDGPADVIGARMGRRSGHFMPTSLLDSQLATLEPLTVQENGVRLSVTLDPAEIVRRFLEETST